MYRNIKIQLDLSFKNNVFNVDKKGLDLVKEISNITKFDYPKDLELIYKNKINKIVWEKENMEQNLYKMIGDFDESC